LYEEALTETVMDAFDFDAAITTEDATGNDINGFPINASQGWKLVEGGMQNFIDGMINYLASPGLENLANKKYISSGTSTYEQLLDNAKIKLGHHVLGVEFKKTTNNNSSNLTINYLKVSATSNTSSNNKKASDVIHSDTDEKLASTSNKGLAKTLLPIPSQLTFNHVINTAPLSLQNEMDMSSCALSLKKRQAIESFSFVFKCNNMFPTIFRFIIQFNRTFC